jgi:septal ring factor EnvC (AmiA/AmiB activator)
LFHRCRQAELAVAHEATAVARKDKAEMQGDLAAARRKAKEASGTHTELGARVASLEEELKKNQTVLTNVRIDKAKCDDQIKTHKKKLKEQGASRRLRSGTCRSDPA